MKKTILIVEEADLVRGYLATKLAEYGFEVIEARTGFEGQMKMKSSQPDLVVMEYLLARITSLEILEDKARTKAIADIPVIMFTSKVDKEKILSVAKYKVARFFSKPLRIDILLKAVSELLNVEIALDQTPCIIDVHMNEQVLFIEVARGLNREKVELLRYKLTETLALYNVQTPRILVLMTDVHLEEADTGKLAAFFQTILEVTRVPKKAVKLLTTSDFVKAWLAKQDRFAGISLVANIGEAMDQLLGIKVSDFVEEGYNVMRDDLLAAKEPVTTDESLQIRFEQDKGFRIAVVDDDLVTRELVATVFRKTGWDVTPFQNGKLFLDALADAAFDLVFLDILMPVMDGFQVMEALKGRPARIPVIVLSSLSQKENVVKALGYGVRSYLAKPLKPEEIRKKAAEILKTDF